MREKKTLYQYIVKYYHPLVFHLLVSFYQINTEANTILTIIYYRKWAKGVRMGWGEEEDGVGAGPCYPHGLHDWLSLLQVIILYHLSPTFVYK